jgi:hypothetical protein
MNQPIQSSFRLSAVTLALILLASAPALGQQPAQAPITVPYNPPSIILITPPTGQKNNPYLIYVSPPQEAPAAPIIQAVPPQPVQAAPITPPVPINAVKAMAGPTLSDLGRSLHDYFTEEELSLLLEYMKESVVASFKGEEVSLPADIAFKLEVLLVRLKKESSLYMDNLIKQLEQDLKRSLEEKLVPPGPPSQQPLQPPPLPQITPALNPAVEPAPPPPGTSKLPAKKSAKNV